MSKKEYLLCRDIKGKAHKISKDEIKFRPSIYAVVIKNNKVLLVPQWNGYDFPGGGVKIGESLDKALEREVWEETGLKAKRGETITVESGLFLSVPSKHPYHTILIYSAVKSIIGKISDKHFDGFEKDYAKKAVWMDLKNINKLKFYNGVDSVKLIKKAKSFYSA